MAFRREVTSQDLKEQAIFDLEVRTERQISNLLDGKFVEIGKQYYSYSAREYIVTRAIGNPFNFIFDYDGYDGSYFECIEVGFEDNPAGHFNRVDAYGSSKYGHDLCLDSAKDVL